MVQRFKSFKRFTVLSLFIAGGGMAIAQSATGPRAGVDWPGFRGISAGGVDDGKPLPLQWSVPDSKLVKWKVPISGLGHSSPIVWGDQVCTASAISGTPDPQLKVGLYGDIGSVLDQTEHKWIVACFDKRTGNRAGKRSPHRSADHQASSQVDACELDAGHRWPSHHRDVRIGRLVCVLAHRRRAVEERLRPPGFRFLHGAGRAVGVCSSPIIHNGRVIIQADVQKGSFVAAFDVRTGRELWRTAREDVPTFSTPSVVSMNGRDQVIVNGWKHIGGYDLETGKEIWRMTGGGDIPVPTPIAGQGLVFITNAHGKASPIYAIKPTATGDITLKEGESSNAHIAWSYMRDGGYMQTPIVYGDILYVCRDNGVLTAFDAKTGTRHYQARLGDGKTGFSASAVAAAGRLYFTSEDGDVYVVKAGPAFELLATNSLGEVAMATPAISEGTLLFRTRNHLVAVGER
jgi:hypothetical protein